MPLQDVIGLFRAEGIYAKSNGSDKQAVLCPKCSHTRKPYNQRKPCLAIDLNTGKYTCQHCNFEGWIKDTDKKKYDYMRKEYRRIGSAKEEGITGGASDVYKYLEVRGIPKETAQKNNIGRFTDKDGTVWIVYNYIKGGKLVNYQKRNIKDKDFRQAGNCEPIMYNYDRCLTADYIIINEGVEDSLSWEAAGYEAHTTVNQGAPNEKDADSAGKLQCLSNSWEIFQNKRKIYICTDNDPNGRRLKEELIRRFGEERCAVITLPNDCKDANETLQKHGPEQLKKCFSEAKDAKPEGVVYMSDRYEKMMSDYNTGKPKGTPTYFKPIDEGYQSRPVFTWQLGQVTVLSGYDNEGKGAFMRYIALLKNAYDDWKWAFFSPEDDDFFENLIHTYIGKNTDKAYGNYMNHYEYQFAMQLGESFFHVDPEEEYSLAGLIKRFDYLVAKEGVRGIVIDPFNKVLHLKGKFQRDDQYLVQFMTALRSFAKKRGVAIVVVAHQKNPDLVYDKDGKPKDYPEPDKRRIKEGGEWGNTADNVLLLHQPYRVTDPTSTLVNLKTEKIKKFTQGVRGVRIHLKFDPKTQRFYDEYDEVPNFLTVKPLAYERWPEKTRNEYEEYIKV